MKNMKNIWFLLLLPMASLAQTADKKFTLKGDLQLTKPIDWVYLRYISGEEPVTDSVQPKNGQFRFEGKIAEPGIAALSVKFLKAAPDDKIQRDGLQFFLEPGNMSISARDSMKTNSVTGSAGHLEYIELMNQQKPYAGKLNQLYEAYGAARKEKNEAAMNKIEEEINRTQADLNEKVFGNYVKTHPNSPLSIFALKQFAGYSIDPEKVEPVFNSLASSVQQYPSAVAFKEKIEIAKKTAIGKYAIDFTQEDTSGIPVSLSSFKGKYVLIDFWASWCGPCRQENPNLVKAFQQYKDKNFTVLGVSLDRPNAKDKWLKAIHDDQLTWTQVSDLKYWDNAVAKQYGIQSIPQNLLIDPKGKIVAKNIRGEDLHKKLQEILK